MMSVREGTIERRSRESRIARPGDGRDGSNEPTTRRTSARRGRVLHREHRPRRRMSGTNPRFRDGPQLQWDMPPYWPVWRLVLSSCLPRPPFAHRIHTRRAARRTAQPNLQGGRCGIGRHGLEDHVARRQAGGPSVVEGRTIPLPAGGGRPAPAARGQSEDRRSAREVLHARRPAITCPSRSTSTRHPTIAITFEWSQAPHDHTNGVPGPEGIEF
jgi:hypothetical protein